MGIREKGDFELIASIRLYKGDRAKLEEYYPQAGYNKAIRRLVRNHLARLDAKLEQRLSAKGLLIEGEFKK